MHVPAPCGLVTLLTDFGQRDPYVGIVKGAVKLQNARAEIVDLCHEVPAQDVEVGALFLRAALDRFPLGTVHVAVVDPGVGTDRRVLAACTAGCYWLAPDNGVLGQVWAGRDDVEVRAVDLERAGLRPQSNTFHGRDVFAPLGGMLSRGRFGFRALGPPVNDPIELPGSGAPGTHRVILVDGFGNLITDVPAQAIAAGGSAVRIAGREVPVRTTYADVPRGELLALVNSYDLVEVAVSHGDANQRLGVGRGEPVELDPGPGRSADRG